MKKCNSCNILFNIKSNFCPLCQNTLTGECCDFSFTNNVWFKTNSLILKILLFVSITTILIFGFIELLIYNNLKYTLYVGLGLFTNFIVIYHILKSYKNIFRMFGRYGFIIILLLLLWYFVIKTPIITNYIIPSVCIFELLFNLIVCIVLRRNYIVKYSSQILMNIFLLFLPIILVWFNLTTNNILPYICSLLSVISIIGLLIFFFNDIKDELEKIFNI